ncbi:M56 family metallopeptidase [Gemmatimonas sp.]|uniref:M56 family metallopeptidase n=1 Tax=Gemmatimonas sp. TaxID=1962908 RepID=UPI002869FB65|nr:M56 family metallopeptidase [Gemmatimonas sp.]
MLNSLSTFLHIPADVVIAAILLVAKATTLLLLALAVTWIMQRTSAVSRHLVWFASLAAILVIPAIVALSPITMPILPYIDQATVLTPAPATDATTPFDGSQRNRLAQAERVAPSTPNNPSTSSFPLQTDAARTGSAASSGASAVKSVPPASIGLWLLGIWAAVAAVLATWLLMGAFSVRRIARRATSLQGTTWDAPLFEIADRLSLADAPRLLMSDDVLMPFACGLTQPTIVLPRSAEQWSTDQRSAVLLHEMAHIKRRDMVGHTVGRFACALYWFHPLVWTAAKRLRAESERACDDLALLCGARPSDYAEQLLDIVSQVKRNTTPPIAMAMATRSEFEGRMLAILDPALRRVAPSRWQSATLLSGAALVAMIIGVAVPASAGPSDARGAAPRELQLGNGDKSAPVLRPELDSVVTDDIERAALTSQLSQQSMPHLATSQPPVAPAARPASPERPSVSPTSLPVAAPAKAARPSTMAGRLPGDEPTDAELGIASIQLIRDALRLAEKDAARNGTKPRLTITPNRDKDTSARAAILIGVLRTDRNGESRRIAAWGLNELTDLPDVVNALAGALKRDTVDAVREMAAWALGEDVAQKGGRLALREAARSDRSTAVQITAIWAMGQSQQPLDDESAEDLGRALSSPSARVREIAAWALGSAAASKAPRALLSSLDDSDASVRKTVAWALHEIEDPAALRPLEAALRREKIPAVQTALVRALSILGEPAVDLLKRLVDDPDATVRATAVRALAGSSISMPWPQPRPQPRPIP